jgi:dipicolinate synthase subunit A
MLHALGFRTDDPVKICHGLRRYRVIFNTVPAPVISEAQVRNCREDCIKIDLASQRGIAGRDVIWARGLPGKDVPESSGQLIAKTVIRLIAGREKSL